MKDMMNNICSPVKRKKGEIERPQRGPEEYDSK